MSNVIDFAKYSRTRPNYDLLSVDELKNEIIKFKVEREKNGGLTLDMVERGIPLFKRAGNVLDSTLCRQYYMHLVLEKKKFKPSNNSSA